MEIDELKNELDILIHQRSEANARNRAWINSRIRSTRISLARKKGNHTKEEWIALVEFFQFKCVRCCNQLCHITVRKDHIVPIYQGGSDGIDNLQPLCQKCNSSKGPEDFNWASYRIAKGF